MHLLSLPLAAMLLLLLGLLSQPLFAAVGGASPMRASERLTASAMRRWQSAQQQPHTQPQQHLQHSPRSARHHALTSSSAAILPSADGATEWNVSRPEGARRFWVRLPSAYNESGADSYPLLLALHGLGDTCENFGPATGFSQLADNATRPFIHVYACGWPGLLGNGWNAGTCCLQPTSVDDVAFARSIVAALASGGVRVDSGRVWVAGFSNGAMMAEVIGCAAADVFSASASVSGVVELEPGNESGLAACDKQFGPALAVNRSLAVWHIHGTADTVVPFAGEALLGFPPILANMRRWVQRVGCQPAVNASTLDSGTYSNVVWSNCSASSYVTAPQSLSVQLVENAGGQHEWPVDAHFDTTAAIVDFLFQSAQGS